MVTIDDIKNGLTKYFDDEIVPNVLSLYDDSSFKHFIKPIVGTILALYVKKVEAIYETYRNNPLITFTGIIDDEGNIDLDMFLNEYEKHIEDIIFTKDTKIGEISFNKEDLNKLKEHINNVSRRE